MYITTKSTKLYLCKKINWLICTQFCLSKMQCWVHNCISDKPRLIWKLNMHWLTYIQTSANGPCNNYTRFWKYENNTFSLQKDVKNEMNEIFTVHDESLTAEFSELWSLLWRCCLISLSSIHTRSPYIDSLSAGWQHHS